MKKFVSVLPEFFHYISDSVVVTQSAFTSSKLTIVTLEQGVKYVQT